MTIAVLRATFYFRPMPAAPYPINEEQRLQDLADLEILNTKEEKEFSDIVELASRICETPISLITLIEKDRQWFKAKKGLEVTETKRSSSFCAHAILQNEIFVVNDALQDQRFVDNELVNGEPKIRFYAGAQILSHNGYKLGTLCVIDSKPKDLTWPQVSALKVLSQQVGKLMELRKLRLEYERTTELLQHALHQTQKLQSTNAGLGILFQAQTKQLHEYITQKLAPLKTGKFTKKELSSIAYQAESKLEQLLNFSTGVALLSNPHEQDNSDLHEIQIHNLAQKIENELTPLLLNRSSKITWHIVDHQTIFQNENYLAFILKTFLHRLLYVTKKAEVVVVSVDRDQEVEFRMSLTNINITEDLRRYAKEKLSPSSLAGSINIDEEDFYDLHILQGLLHKTGCRYEIEPLGNAGTTVAVKIPKKIF